MGTASIKPRELLVKCLYERVEDQWVGLCLDFSLVSQAGSLPEAQRKLEEQIHSYVYDATAGEDRAYAADLLLRKAGLSEHIKFYAVLGVQVIRHRMSRSRRAVKESVPMVPMACA